MPAGRRDGWSVGIVALVLGAALLAAAHTVADPDLWGHVRFGQLILAEGGVVRSDPFSYLSAGHPWINHEWLAEVLFALAFRWGGDAGLVGLKAALSLSIVGVAYVHLLRKGLDPLRAGIAVVFLVALVRIGIATVRPHLFTYLLFFAVLLVLEAAEGGRRRWLWALPPVFAMWANLHGGFLAGLGILAAWAATLAGVELVESVRGRGTAPPVAPRNGPTHRGLAWWAGGALVASLLATLLNPYGTGLLEFVARTATAPRPEITEWRPVRIQSVPGFWYLVFVALLSAAVLRGGRPRRPGALAVLGVAAIVPLLAVRHLPLFGLAGIVMGADHLAGAFERGRDRARPGTPVASRGALRSAVAAVLVIAGIGLGAAAVPRFGCIELEEGYYPVRAVRLLDESGAEGNLAVFFNWGEYAIWHLAPRVRVSMDGRRETVYPDSIYREHLRFVRGTGEWDSLLERRPTDAALVEAVGPTSNLLRLKPGWTLVSRDSVAALFARDGWAGGEGLRAAREAGIEARDGRQCFP